MIVTKSFMYLALLLCYATALKVRYTPCTTATPPPTTPPTFDRKIVSVFFKGSVWLKDTTLLALEVSTANGGSTIKGKPYDFNAVIGYCSSQSHPTLVPLYIAYNADKFDHWFTTDKSTYTSGYIDEGILCHVYPPPTSPAADKEIIHIFDNSFDVGSNKKANHSYLRDSIIAAHWKPLKTGTKIYGDTLLWIGKFLVAKVATPVTP